jgi:hypothetical protein
MTSFQLSVILYSVMADNAWISGEAGLAVP